MEKQLFGTDGLRGRVNVHPMILLNRRGYAPMLYCLDCENPVRCPECELSLTFHKDRERLVCHYCGYTRPHPAPCPTCGGTNFLPMQLVVQLTRQLRGALTFGSGQGTVFRLSFPLADAAEADQPHP